MKRKESKKSPEDKQSMDDVLRKMLGTSPHKHAARKPQKKIKKKPAT